jgi:hypothetical protein
MESCEMERVLHPSLGEQFQDCLQFLTWACTGLEFELQFAIWICTCLCLDSFGALSSVTPLCAPDDRARRGVAVQVPEVQTKKTCIIIEVQTQIASYN